MQRLEERRNLRIDMWRRRNRSASWLIDHAIEHATRTDRLRGFALPMRPARCGWPLGRVDMTLIDGRAYATGLEHCASPWACPVCTPVIRARRARDLQRAADRWTGEGHALVFVTLTRPHTKSEPLADGLDLVARAWSDMTGSQRWRKLRNDLGIRHHARSVEITWSPGHGWHAHVHALLFADAPVDRKRLQDELCDMWGRALEHLGSRRPSKRHGVLCENVETTPEGAASYLSKPPDRIGSEITRMDRKQGRGHDSLTPFQLLDPPVIRRLGEWRARSLWIEYVESTQRRRSITWSRHLRSSLVGGREASDRQIIDDTIPGMRLYPIAPRTWRRLRRSPTLLAHLCSRTETGEVPIALDIIRLIAHERDGKTDDGNDEAERRCPRP
ncbi:protein rep [Bifidobacterium simiarum]|uniref:Uncharacterized protein n=1 Tax=Bifidobacterium simiarum TaxID=2045441 RepID=A0A2M9HC57_9BIFI|nr:protein rep [Bifidobacterium simiarum]PJM74399.1 hypothetical protein CSQ87_10370 [Bifidobacterium simiarum]